MIVTDNEAWAKKAKYLTTQAKDNPLEYIHKEIGYNYRLTNIQAAMGCAQMEKIDDYIEAKRKIADYYQKAFEDVSGITTMSQASWAESVFWLYTILVDEDLYGMDSRALLNKLAEKGVQTRPLWYPLSMNPSFHDLEKVKTPVAVELNLRAISLPCSVGLTREEQNHVIEAIRD